MFEQVGSADMRAAVAGWAPGGGRRLCARVTGSPLQFKVWPSHRDEPSWEDPTFTRHVSIPADWVVPGRTGLYIAHLEPGAWAELTRYTTAVASSAG